MTTNLTKYQTDPAGYARDVLKVDWWGKQIDIANALVKHKRVFVKASHSIGKSFLAAGLVNWFFDCFEPAIVLTTAPTKDQVVDVLWKEVRRQRKDKTYLQPKAPRMEKSESHYAVGYTAASGDAFQGRHEKNVLIVFDEAVGIPAEFWEASEGMMTNSENCYWLAICNPTDTSSQAFIEAEQSDKWHTISVSALEHPNIAAALRGEPVPFPAAVSIGWVRDRIKEWCDRIDKADARAADFEFDGKWFRPGPLFESRVMGRWPSDGGYSIWSEAKWSACLVQRPVDWKSPLQIGCDVARFGDDYTEIVVRRGNAALHHERHNGWSTSQTAGRLKDLARKWALPSELFGNFPILIDDGGVGGGVVDQADGFNFIGVNAGSKANDESGYPNKRSELWFACADRADEGRIDVSRLSSESRAVLRRQLFAPIWKMDSQGRRVVEPKSDTKKRIGGSPDSADAWNLAYYAAADWNAAAAWITKSQERNFTVPDIY